MDASASIDTDITAMILTFNEAPNIARTLDAVAWVKEILVVDSGSTDETLAIVARYPNARVMTRKFDTAAQQCNFGLNCATTRWILSLDADYELSADASNEIRRIDPTSAVVGYEASFIYRIFGRELSASLYPPRTVFYLRTAAHYRDYGHTQRVLIDGRVVKLQGKIYHDDRKSLDRYFSSQQRYARREVDHLLAAPRNELRRSDRIRLMGWPAPILVFFYTLFWKSCIFDGWPGWLYVLQRTLAETMIALEIVDRRLRAGIFVSKA